MKVMPSTLSDRNATYVETVRLCFPLPGKVAGLVSIEIECFPELSLLRTFFIAFV